MTTNPIDRAGRAADRRDGAEPTPVTDVGAAARGDPARRRRAAEPRAPRRRRRRAPSPRCARRSTASSPTTTAATGGPRRGFELREVGGGWRLYVRAEHDDLVARLRQHPGPVPAVAGRARDPRGDRLQAAHHARAGRLDPRRERRLRGAHAARPRPHHRAFTDAETGAINYGTTELLLNLGINSLDELPHISPLLEDGAEGFDDDDIR